MRIVDVLSCCALAAAACNSDAGGSAGADMMSGPPDLIAAADLNLGPCTGVMCAGDHVVCDALDGKCKLDGTTTNVGHSCAMSGADPICGTDTNATCNDLAQDDFPGGYCSVEPCTSMRQCPLGSSCGRLGGEAPACFLNCTSDAQCRTP